MSTTINTPAAAPAPAQPDRLSNGWFVLAVLIPIAGIVLAIIEWAKGNTGRGFAFATAATVAFLIYFAVACGAAVDDYSTCVNNAQTVQQQLNC